MKRFWIGLGLLALVLVLGIWVGGAMLRLHMPITMDLEQAAAYAEAGHWAASEALYARAKSRWDAGRNRIAAIYNHQPLDEIDARFRELEVFLSRREVTACRAGCVYLAERLRDLSDSFRISWENLL